MELYWWFRAASLHAEISFIGAVAFIVAIVLTVVLFIPDLDECGASRAKKIIKYSLITFVACELIVVTTPTREELAIMFAWDGIKSDSVQEVVELLKERYLK